MTELRERYLQIRPAATRVCKAMEAEIEKIGMDRDSINPRLERARFELHRDPALGQTSLVGVWRNAEGMKQGEILFHEDGSFFAEYDVVCPHPSDSRWFIEAVTAWGKGEEVKSELRLLPAVG